jgi:hypothetical protein
MQVTHKGDVDAQMKFLKDGTDGSPPFKAEVRKVLSFISVQAFCGPDSKHSSKDHERTDPSYIVNAEYGSYCSRLQ